MHFSFDHRLLKAAVRAKKKKKYIGNILVFEFRSTWHNLEDFNLTYRVANTPHAPVALSLSNFKCNDSVSLYRCRGLLSVRAKVKLPKLHNEDNYVIRCSSLAIKHVILEPIKLPYRRYNAPDQFRKKKMANLHFCRISLMRETIFEKKNRGLGLLQLQKVFIWVLVRFTFNYRQW